MKRPGMLRGLKRTLLSGLFVVAPFSLTFLLLSWFVAGVDRAMAPVSGMLGYRVPGLGLAAALAIVLGVGALANNIAGQHLLEYFEDILLRIPVFNWLYRTIKQVADVFSPHSRNAFRSVVLIEYPRPGVYSVGFVTNELQLELVGESEKLVCVYVPTNHMYVGDYILVPPARILKTDLTLQEGLQSTISAGASLPLILKASLPQTKPTPTP